MGATAGAAILAWALLATAAAAASSVRLAPALDLAADARAAAASGRALVLLYATADCPWCRRVRQEFLIPMQRSPVDAKRVLVREIDIESNRPLVGVDDEPTTHARFATARGLRFVPVVTFHGADGVETAERLVGFRTADWYGAYLDRRIDTARSRMPQP
jgi:thioredoxin-related protein